MYKTMFLVKPISYFQLKLFVYDSVIALSKGYLSKICTLES